MGSNFLPFDICWMKCHHGVVYCLCRSKLRDCQILVYREAHTQTHCIFLPNTNLITSILGTKNRVSLMMQPDWDGNQTLCISSHLNCCKLFKTTAMCLMKCLLSSWVKIDREAISVPMLRKHHK